MQQLTKGIKRIGVVLDHISVDCKKRIEDALPGVELADIVQPAMWMRSIKSIEEHKLIRERAHICNEGGRVVTGAVKAGVPEQEVAIAPTSAMIRETAKSTPFVELMDTWTCFQSGINTDGTHSLVTNKAVQAGEILSLNTFPMIFGCCTALECKLFCEHASNSHINLWVKNCDFHRARAQLIKPRKTCSEIAGELNDMYCKWDLLKYRSFEYGHSFGVLSHSYSRETGVELREDVHTELRLGIVVSMEPMIMIPEGQPGAGGYREQFDFHA